MSWPLALGTVKGRLMASNSSGGGFVITDVHESRDKIFVNLSRKKGSSPTEQRCSSAPALFTSHTWSRQVPSAWSLRQGSKHCVCHEIKEEQERNKPPMELKKEFATREVLKITC